MWSPSEGEVRSSSGAEVKWLNQINSGLAK